MKHDVWPDLPYAAWKDTYATLHLWTQIVGKIRSRADAVGQPLLARHALRIAARPNHIFDSVRAAQLRA